MHLANLVPEQDLVLIIPVPFRQRADRAEMEVHEQLVRMEALLLMFIVKRNNGERDAGEPLLRGDAMRDCMLWIYFSLKEGTKGFIFSVLCISFCSIGPRMNGPRFLLYS